MVRSTTYLLDYEESILSAYRNKHLFLWFCKQGNTYKAIICQGGHINETIVPGSFQANRIVIHLPYKIQRIGFSRNFYDLYEKEFIMCILCTPQPMYRSISFDRHSTDVSVDISTDNRPICRSTYRSTHGRYIDRDMSVDMSVDMLTDISAECRLMYRPTVGRYLG